MLGCDVRRAAKSRRRVAEFVGLRLARAANSFSEFAGSVFGTTTSTGGFAINETPSKSLTASKDRFAAILFRNRVAVEVDIMVYPSAGALAVAAVPGTPGHSPR